MSILDKIRGIKNGGPELEGEAMKMDLGAKFDDLEARDSKINEMKASGIESLNKFKKESLDKVFGMMQDAGVDPGDLESISKFMQKLEEQDPDLAIMFRKAMDALIPKGEGEEGESKSILGALGSGVKSPEGLMDMKMGEMQRGAGNMPIPNLDSSMMPPLQEGPGGPSMSPSGPGQMPPVR